METKSNVARNKMLRNNILFSGVLKAISLYTSFLIVPITLNYLDNEPYGIWMTITSMAFWVAVFDIGLGNGMRNYLTAAISKGDFKAAGIYISSTFFLLSGIALVLAIFAIPLLYSLDIASILNTSNLSSQSLRLVFLVALMLILVNFVLKNIGFIYVALQRYAINDLLTVMGNVLALIFVYILTKTTEGNLLYIVVTLLAMPLLAFIIGGIPLFIKYPAMRPSFKKIDIGFSKGVIKKGLGFFVIQTTSCLIIFGGSNLFISHFCGPESVTTYNIAYKYFNLIIIGYTILIAPMWNAYTDAYVKGDWKWIQKTFKRSFIGWCLTLAVGAVMLLGCNLFYNIWVGEKVTVPVSISLSVLIFITCFNLNNCVTYLLNGLNTIYVQIWTSIAATAAYIAWVATYGRQWGAEGIVLGMAVCYAVMSIIHLYQCRLIITRKASGIWIK